MAGVAPGPVEQVEGDVRRRVAQVGGVVRRDAADVHPGRTLRRGRHQGARRGVVEGHLRRPHRHRGQVRSGPGTHGDQTSRGRGSRERAGHVEDGAPVPPQQAVGATSQPAPDLGVQVRRGRRPPSRCGRRRCRASAMNDVGVVGLLPVELAHQRHVEQPARQRSRPSGRAARPARARRGRRARPRRSRRTPPGSPGRTGPRRAGPRGSPTRTRGTRPPAAPRGPAGSGRRGRPSARPSPRRPGRRSAPRRPGLERRRHDRDLRVRRQPPACLGGQPLPQLHRHDPAAPRGQWQCGDARTAADLEEQ